MTEFRNTPEIDVGALGSDELVEMLCLRLRDVPVARLGIAANARGARSG